MDKKKVINLGIGILLAVVAIMIINNRLQERERMIRRLIQEGEVVEVLVASQDIRKGEVVRENMLGFMRTHSSELKPNALRSPESAIGKVARVDILPRQEILANMLKLPTDTQVLSQRTPRGRRAYTISIDRVSAVGGNVKAGDRVDVVGIMQLPQTPGQTVMTLFEGARVLTVEEAGRNLDSITLALTSDEIKALTFALENGKVKLVLRSPLDEPEGIAFQPFTYDTFIQKIYQAMGISLDDMPVEVPEDPGVEIYRGGESR